MANIHSTITYNANLTPAQAQIKSLTGQIAGLTAAFNTLDASARKSQTSLANAFAADVGQIGGFTTQTVKAHNAVESFGKQLAANKLSMREYFREAITGYTRQNSMLKQLAAQQVKYQQSVMIPTGPGQGMVITPNNLAATGTAAAMASQKFSIFNELIDGGANKLLNFGKNTQWAGRQLMVGFTVPLMMFTAVMSKQFRDLDKELTRFQKVYGSDLGNAFGESTMRMREQVEELAYSISRTYGIAAKETAALAADIAATGQEGQALLDSVQQTTRLAVLGEVDRQEAMKATLAIQSAFKQDTNELAESINFLNAVENQTSTTLEDLSTAIPKVGPVVRSLGGDIEDLATLLVAMREGGIPAAEAANALKSGLASLINPTKQASEVAKKFGVDLVGIVEANKGQLMPTIYGVQEALSGLDSFSRSKVIEQIFGKYQFARMTALFDNIGKTGSQTQQVLELASKSSADLAAIANTEIKALTESTSVKFMRTLEELKNSLMPLAETLTKTLIPIFDTIGKGIRMFSDFFQALPEPIKNFVKYGVAITALAGPVIMLVGLFGNLIANGIKFGMMLTRMGARIAGLRFEKFELLNADVMAAKIGVDNLTKSFDTQEAALARLIGVMTNYENSLRRMSTANPALFIPGAMPGRGGQVPIRRQTGSTRPEFVPGTGRGDKVPALLEPGEFIVNKSATQKYAPVLVAMNRGSLPGFQEGGSPNRLAHITGSRTVPITSAMEVASPAARRVLEEMLRQGITEVKTFNNLVVNLSKATNDALNTEKEGGGVRKSILAAELQEKNRWATMMKATGVSFDQLQPTIKGITGAMDRLEGELINDPQLYKIVEAELIKLSNAGDVAAQRLLAMSKQYGTFEYLRTQEGKVRPGRAALGVAASGVGTYKGGRLAADSWVRESLLNFEKALDQAMVRALRSSSPSKNAELIAKEQGKNIAQGALNGLRTGMAVPKTGIESISNAQKVAKADQTILKFKTMQQKYTADRVRAEVELAALDGRLAQIKNNEVMSSQDKLRATLALNRERIILEGKQKEAAANETRIQNIINGYKERIAEADKAQLRSEQEEAKAAARRATAAMVAPGGIYGPGGYNVFGTVGRTASTKPGPTVPGSSAIITGPSKNINDARNISSNRSMNAMNSMFAISMAASSLSMLGVTSEDASAKLGLFTTALMTATMLMNTGIGKGAFTNFLGLGSLGGKVSAKAGEQAAARAVAGTGPVVASSLATRQVGTVTAGSAALGRLGGGLAMGGRALSFLGGPVGIAAGIGITAAIAGYMAYKNAADEARERAIAAFEDPVKSAEYFGTKITDVSSILEKTRLNTLIKDINQVDQGLKDAVKEDYGPLIEQIKYLSQGAGAQVLSTAYSNMIISGMSAENAKATIEAIATEAGSAGGKAFNEALSSGFLDSSITIEQAINNIVNQFNPSTAYNKNGLGMSLINKLNEEKAAIEQAIKDLRESTDSLSLGQTIFPDFMLNEPTLALKELERSLDAVKDRIEDLSTISPDQISPTLDALIMAYEKDPSAAIDGLDRFVKSMYSLKDGDFETSLSEIDKYLEKGYGEQWKDFSQEIDTSSEKVAAMRLLVAQIPLEYAVDQTGQWSAALANAAANAKSLADNAKIAAVALQLEYDQMISDFFETQREDYRNQIDMIQSGTELYIEGVEDQKEASEEAFEAQQEASEVTVEGYQDQIEAIQDKIDINNDEIEVIQERIEKEKEASDEKIKALEEEKSLIQESSDAYIDSLKKKERADDYYAQQRKTSLSALEKLASGDVFGFLQERETLSQQAQKFSYDEMISGIEERKDLEIEAIDETIEKEQERQQKWEENQQNKIDKIQEENDKLQESVESIQDLIELEQERMDVASKAHQEAMEQYDEDIQGAKEAEEQKVIYYQQKIADIEGAEQKYKDDATKAETEFSKEYAELKSKPFVEARKELTLLKVQEIYYRGGITLEQAIGQAGLIAPFGPENRIQASMAAADIAAQLGITGPLNQPYQNLQESTGDTVDTTGMAQSVGQMDVTAGTVIVNGTTTGTGTTSTGTPPANNVGQYWPTTGSPTHVWDSGSGSYVPIQGLNIGGAIKYRGGGGKILGPGTGTSDSIPALLSNGEYVIRASSVAKYGKQFMDSVNRGQLQGFDGGGQPYKPTQPDYSSGSPEEHRTPEEHREASGQNSGGSSGAYTGSPEERRTKEQHRRASGQTGGRTNFYYERQGAEGWRQPQSIVRYQTTSISPFLRGAGSSAVTYFGGTPTAVYGEGANPKNIRYTLGGDKLNQLMTNVFSGQYNSKQLESLMEIFGISNRGTINIGNQGAILKFLSGMLQKSGDADRDSGLVSKLFNELAAAGGVLTGRAQDLDEATIMSLLGMSKEQLLGLQYQVAEHFRSMPRWMKQELLRKPREGFPTVAERRNAFQAYQQQRLLDISKQSMPTIKDLQTRRLEAIQASSLDLSTWRDLSGKTSYTDANGTFVYGPDGKKLYVNQSDQSLDPISKFLLDINRQGFADFITRYTPDQYDASIGAMLSGNPEYGKQDSIMRSIGASMFASQFLPAVGVPMKVFGLAAATTRAGLRGGTTAISRSNPGLISRNATKLAEYLGFQKSNIDVPVPIEKYNRAAHFSNNVKDSVYNPKMPHDVFSDTFNKSKHYAEGTYPKLYSQEELAAAAREVHNSRINLNQQSAAQEAARLQQSRNQTMHENWLAGKDNPKNPLISGIPRLPISEIVRVLKTKFPEGSYLNRKKAIKRVIDRWIQTSFPRYSVSKELRNQLFHGSKNLTIKQQEEILKSLPLMTRDPLMFHGTTNPVKKFSAPSAEQYVKTQLGPYGTYTSNSLVPVSDYARGSTSGLNVDGVILRALHPKAPFKALDLRSFGKPIPDDIADILSKELSGSTLKGQRTRPDYEYAADFEDTILPNISKEEYQEIIDANNKYSSLGIDRINIFNELSTLILKKMGMEDMFTHPQFPGMQQSIKNKITEILFKNGYDAIKHDGGLRVGNYGHTVTILPKPESQAAEFFPFLNIPKFGHGGIVNKRISNRKGAGDAGPNGWPWSTSYLATKTIPGTGKSITMDRRVLPLFLALAADYNKRIRTIGPLTGGYRGGASLKSNHPSGTALDINWSDEGGLEEMYAPGDVGNSLYNWWKSGTRSDRAPWAALSPQPYLVANEYEDKTGGIIQWFGPTSLGGYITPEFQPNDPGIPGYDYMHFQISQSRSVSPGDVEALIQRLGINENGEFINGGSFGSPSGGGTPGTSASGSGATGTGTGGEPQTQTVTTISFGPGDLGPGDRFLASKLSLLGERTVTTTTVTTGGGETTSTSASGGSSATGGATGGTPGAGGITLNPADYQDSVINGYKLVKLIYGTGWTNKDEVRTGYGVVMGESGGQRRNLRDYRSDMKGRDWGLWQINDYWHKSVNGEPIDFGERIFDAIYNSKIAFGIAKDPSSMQIWGSQWGSWNAFTNNTPEYQRGMSEFDANPEWWNQLVQETGGNARAGGGSIKGKGTSTSDSIPALLSNGEYVIRASSVSKYGKTFMDDLNAGKFATGGIVRPKRFGGGGIGRIFGNSKINQSSKTRATWPEDVENPYPEDEPFVGMPDDMYEEWLTYDFQMPYYETSFGFKAPLFWMVDPTGLYTSTGPGPDDWEFDGEEWAKRFKETIKEWTNIKPTWKKLWDKKPGGRAFANGGLVRPKRFGGGGINRIFGNSKINQSGPNRGVWPEDAENPYPEDESFVGMPDAMYEEWLTYDFQMPYYETSFGFKVPLFWMVDPTGLYTSTGPGPDDWSFDGEEWAKRYKNTIKEWTNIKPSWKKLWDKQPGVKAFAEGGLVKGFNNKKPSVKIKGFEPRTRENTRKLPPPGDTGGGINDKPKPRGNPGQIAVKFAKQQIGEPYVIPASPPNSWDCSKLTAWSWAVATGASPNKGYWDKKAKLILPQISHDQGRLINKTVVGYDKNGKISTKGLKVGDILYYAQNGVDVLPGHVQLYAGNGTVVEAGSPVQTNPLNNSWNLSNNFMWAGSPKGYAGGGFINGPGTSTSDSIPALLSDGEYVVRASSVAKYGKGFMDRVNSGQLGFADGGFVGSSVPSEPTFNMPEMASVGAEGIANTINNSIGGASSSNSSNSSNIKIVVNASKGQSTKSIANQVVKLINNSNSRRVHNRSI